MSDPQGPWEAVIGQPAAVAAFRRALAADELGHAWLLVGPSEVGQRELSRALAMALNCREPLANDLGCGRCTVCTRIERGVHPAVDDLEPEGQHHVVDSVRSDWIPTATRTLTEGRRRVMRVVAADRMNEAAQNAFLKILEEPPASVIWLLEAQDDGMLLDTIMSRCRRLDLTPWGPDALEAMATRVGVPPELRKVVARAALGSPRRLLDLTDPDVAEARRRHLGLVDRLAVAGPGEVVPMARELGAWSRERANALKSAHAEQMAAYEEAFGVDGSRGWPAGVKQRLTKRFERLERQERRRALDLVLDDLGSWLRDLLVAGDDAHAEGIVNIDHHDQLRRDVQRLSASEIVAALAAISECRQALDRNGNPELQLERMLFAIALPLYARSVHSAA